MSQTNSKQSQKRNRLVRMIILVTILAGVTTMGLLHQFAGIKPVGVDALCPFGGLESLFSIVTTGAMLQRIASSSFILLAATIVVALIFRRSFCGNICPLGTLQELVGKLGHLIFHKRFQVPRIIDGFARSLKYVALAAILVLSFAFGSLIIRPYDPWVAYQHLASAELWTAFIAGFVILIVSLVGSLLYDRFFCKYLCPMGGFLALFKNLSFFRIRRNESSCIACSACDKACPVNLKVSSLKTVNNAECIDCDECVNACPVPATLTISGPSHKSGQRISVSPLVRLGATAAIFCLVIGVSSLTGSFQWIVPPLSAAQTFPASGENHQTKLNVAEINGSNTFKEIAELTGIPKEAFIKQFKLSEAEFEGELKAVAHRAIEPYEVQLVRDFVEANQ